MKIIKKKESVKELIKNFDVLIENDDKDAFQKSIKLVYNKIMIINLYAKYIFFRQNKNNERIFTTYFLKDYSIESSSLLIIKASVFIQEYI